MRPADMLLSLAKERGVKQAFLVNLIGGYRGQATDWKNGKSSPSEEDFKVFADYFDVDASYFYSESANIDLKDTENRSPTINGERPVTRRQALMAELSSVLEGRTDEELERDLDVLLALKKK